MKKTYSLLLSIIALGTAQAASATTAWIGDANYAQAPGAFGDESTVTNFTTYDFGAGASLIKLGSSVVSGNLVTGQFSGYYQSMVTDHFFQGIGKNIPDLNTSGAAGDGLGFEITLLSQFSGNFVTDITSNFTSFTGLSGDVSLFFDTTPDFSFSADTGFDDNSGTDGGAILSGEIIDGNGFVSGVIGIGVNELELNFDGLFGSYDTDVFSPDTIGGGTALFSIALNNLTTGSVSNQILNGSQTVQGVSALGTDVLLAESDGTLSLTTAVVPLPAGIWFLGSGLLSLMAVARRKSQV